MASDKKMFLMRAGVIERGDSAKALFVKRSVSAIEDNNQPVNAIDRYNSRHRRDLAILTSVGNGLQALSKKFADTATSLFIVTPLSGLEKIEDLPEPPALETLSAEEAYERRLRHVQASLGVLGWSVPLPEIDKHLHIFELRLEGIKDAYKGAMGAGHDVLFDRNESLLMSLDEREARQFYGARQADIKPLPGPSNNPKAVARRQRKTLNPPPPKKSPTGKSPRPKKTDPAPAGPVHLFFATCLYTQTEAAHNKRHDRFEKEKAAALDRTRKQYLNSMHESRRDLDVGKHFSRHCFDSRVREIYETLCHGDTNTDNTALMVRAYDQALTETIDDEAIHNKILNNQRRYDALGYAWQIRIGKKQVRYDAGAGSDQTETLTECLIDALHALDLPRGTLVTLHGDLQGLDAVLNPSHASGRDPKQVRVLQTLLERYGVTVATTHNKAEQTVLHTVNRKARKIAVQAAENRKKTLLLPHHDDVDSAPVKDEKPAYHRRAIPFSGPASSCP